jgi:hypothetical protein
VVSESGKVLKVRRIRQKPAECAIASSVAVAQYYNKLIEYRAVSRAMDSGGRGLYTPEIGTLLNRLGFTKVTVVSADLDYFDYTWRDREKLLAELLHSKRYEKDADTRKVAAAYVKFLTTEGVENELILNHHFGDYIRKSIDANEPVMISFNFNMFHELGKQDDAGKVNPRKGSCEQHEVIVNGYDAKGVSIVDSHTKMYKGRLSKFRNGRYKMTWETLMTVMGSGDVILPSGYSKERFDNELVQKK